jgi:hypothetical protein
VSLERAGDTGNAVGAERRPAFDVVPVDGLDERQRRDLLEVFEWLGASAVAPGEAAGA